jgi:hypothetical protein
MPDNEEERIEALLKEATTEAATSLAELGRVARSKEARKSARRALYLLIQRGLRPLPEASAVDALPDAPALDMVRAYATGYDGAGNRILFFEIAEQDGGNPTAVQMLVNDVLGLQTCDSARLTRHDLRRRIRQMEQLQTEGLAFVEIPADYGRQLLEEARELLRRQNKQSPPGVLELLPRLGVPRHNYLVSPLSEVLSIERLRAVVVSEDPAALFELKWFENWFFAVEDVLRALEDWERLAVVPAETDADDIQVQREAIVRELATSLFTPAVRSRYVRRLEDSADILYRLSHFADTELALLHAHELAAEGAVADVPFARALVERTLVAGLAIQNEKRAERARQG